MNRAQKEAAIAELRPMFEKSHFYIADCSGLDANQLYLLRNMLYKENIECKFVANAFLQILFLQTTYEPLTKVLQGNSVVFFTKENPSKPAKIIKQFKKETKAKTPLFKAACAFDELFIGEEHFNTLLHLKSKEERIAELLHRLQSPMVQLLNGLKHSQENLLGILKTIENK